MMDLIVNKDLAHAMLGRLTEAYIKRCEDYLGRLGDYIQVVLVNDDLGTQIGPMLSLDCYREMDLYLHRSIISNRMCRRRISWPWLRHSRNTGSMGVESPFNGIPLNEDVTQSNQGE